MIRCFFLCLILYLFIFNSFVFLFAVGSKGVEPIEVYDKHGNRIILYEKSYALLIGVSDYTDEKWADIKFIPGEIKRLEESLKKHKFIIQTSLNPTSVELKATIEKFISDNVTKKNNRLLIFFSGHGCTRNEGKKGYIVPADAPRPDENVSEFVNKAIEMEQIHTWAKKIESKHALFVFDSCFSGTIFTTRGNSEIPKYISNLTGKPVRQFITAGDENERVPGKSVFLDCFINGIEGEANCTIDPGDSKDSYITGTELGIYLQKKVPEYPPHHTPQFGKIMDPELNKGDFVFVLEDIQLRKKERREQILPLDFITMAHIPSGNYLRGTNKTQIKGLIHLCSDWKQEFFKNETPQKEIFLDSFYISKYEITNEQYKKFLDDNPSHEYPAFWYNDGFNKPDQPVVGVSWHDAVSFCQWLTNKTRETYRLPTEAEWEIAARGKDGRFFPWGNKWPNHNLANFINEFGHTVSVRVKQIGASPFKVIQMAGNVAEWCSDWYDENYYKRRENFKNPPGPPGGKRKVVRGGGWDDNAFYLRCAARGNYPPDTRSQFIGFRIALESSNNEKIL